MEEHSRYDVADFADELAGAPGNHEVGTARWFENDHVRVWEVRLEPGERGAFHIHDQTYFPTSGRWSSPSGWSRPHLRPRDAEPQAINELNFMIGSCNAAWCWASSSTTIKTNMHPYRI